MKFTTVSNMIINMNKTQELRVQQKTKSVFHLILKCLGKDQKNYSAFSLSGSIKKSNQSILITAIQNFQKERNFGFHIGTFKFKFIYEEICDHTCKGKIPGITIYFQ